MNNDNAKNILIFALTILSCVSVFGNLYQSNCWNKACELVECYDRVVDTIDEDYFLDVICTTDEWRDLQIVDGPMMELKAWIDKRNGKVQDDRFIALDCDSDITISVAKFDN